jgi:hypothetical protein
MVVTAGMAAGWLVGDTIHGNSIEIVPLLEYLVGRKFGRYRASHPSWIEKRIHNFGYAA